MPFIGGPGWQQGKGSPGTQTPQHPAHSRPSHVAAGLHPFPPPKDESLQSLPPTPSAVFAPQGHSRLPDLKDSQGGGRPSGRVGGDLGQVTHRSPRVTLCPPTQL